MFENIVLQVPKLYEVKLKEVVFIGLDIRKPLSDTLFPKTMNETEKEVWESFRDAVHRFLVNKKNDKKRRLYSAC